jgi:beta-xylosidase
MKWVNDWPVIGEDKDGDGKGEPVMVYKKPNVGRSDRPGLTGLITTPAESDEFNENKIGLQWQWQANPKPYWAFPISSKSDEQTDSKAPFRGLGVDKLRLFSVQLPDSAKNYFDVPNLFMQKFPAETFTVTTKLSFQPRLDGEKAGLIVFGLDYAYIALEKKADGIHLMYSICKNAEKGKEEMLGDYGIIKNPVVYLQVIVSHNARCTFTFSDDEGKHFAAVGQMLDARPGKWVGAKVGLFCTRTVKTNDSGWVDVDWFRVE